MSTAAQNWSYVALLRERAAARLSGGDPLDLSRASTSEAMAVLYKLASSPDSAGDARALLHELQVHQVEVEMQHEELLQSCALLEDDLIRQTARMAHAPAAFPVVDGATVVCEVNAAGARMLVGPQVMRLWADPCRAFCRCPVVNNCTGCSRWCALALCPKPVSCSCWRSTAPRARSCAAPLLTRARDGFCWCSCRPYRLVQAMPDPWRQVHGPAAQ
jgi:hypothetical protein